MLSLSDNEKKRAPLPEEGGWEGSIATPAVGGGGDGENGRNSLASESIQRFLNAGLLSATFESDQIFREIQLSLIKNAIKCIADRMVERRRWSIATFKAHRAYCSRATPRVDALRRYPKRAAKHPRMAWLYCRAASCPAAGHSPKNIRPPFGGLMRARSTSRYQKKIAYRINSGIGTPSNQSRIIFMADLLSWNVGYRSRRRPPQVALRLAKNAPISRVMNSHSAA